jgi:hypothetical protein
MGGKVLEASIQATNTAMLGKVFLSQAVWTSFAPLHITDSDDKMEEVYNRLRP